MNIKDLNQVNENQVGHAGARYTPQIDPDAPNLEISQVVKAFDALAYSDSWENRLQNLADELEEKWDNARERTRKPFRKRVQTPKYVLELLRCISNRSPNDDKKELRKLTRATHFVEQKIDETSDELLSEYRNAEEDEKKRNINYERQEHQKVKRAVNKIVSFVNGPEHALLREKVLFLTGEWGTGKTHFLCDLTEHRMEKGLPTLIVLAETLPDNVPPLKGICEITNLAPTPQQLLSNLQNLGEQTDGRALLLIDGINESDRELWRSELESLIDQVRKYPHVGVAISCRTPFDKQIVTSTSKTHLVQVEHYGFQNKEFDAQAEFFNHYDIPTPYVPLLRPEFSRPLFLKIICEAITRKNPADRRAYLESIASGQRGMTDVLEHFARVVGKGIENDFDIDRKDCWRILKGTSTGTTARSGIAGVMADEIRDYVTREEALEAIRDETNCSEAESEDILDRMISEGLLAETIHWDQEQIEVIRFPYQRFGDHIIARHLLAEYLSTDSEEAIRRSFYVNRPLGQIFKLEHEGTQFAQPGLAAAIMLEFPERIKRVQEIPEEGRELVFYLPKKRRRSGAVKNVFLDGLYWRNANSFCQQTEKVIRHYLDHPNDMAQRETLEVLVGLAPRSGHPHDGNELYNYLEDMEMQVRDEKWSEYLRLAGEQSAVNRILVWIKKTSLDELSEDAAQNIIRLLSTFLTTTVKQLRDRATKVLYLVGLFHPELLFEETINTLSFNDPYLPERMLASCYGVAMSLWADPEGEKLRSALPDFATTLTEEMFEEDASHSTKHILIRQYARGIIELALKINKNCMTQKQKGLIELPLNHIDPQFPNPDNINEDELEAVESAFQMDFSNYTVGKLVPGRGNYDFEHSEYQEIFQKIKWRVKDLGYSYDRFETIDERIKQGHTPSRINEGGQIASYGEKYSWIAFFEMYGQRVDEGVLPTCEDEVHPTDCDIDPSFPPQPPTWQPEIPEVFEDEYADIKEWIKEGPEPDYEGLLKRETVDRVKGPWVLLDGYIERSPKEDPRKIFTFLRGVLIDESDIDAIAQKLEEVDYPGNWKIPDPVEDLYTYAGEIPWSERFAPLLRNKDGTAKRNTRKAFSPPGDESSGIAVEIPVNIFSWEFYHSELNQVTGIRFPAPALCEWLKLVNHSQTLDLFDSNGARSTMYREFHSDGADSASWMIYIRKDLLEAYLNKTEQSIIWFPWGERRLNHEEFQRREDELSDIFSQHNNIHKNVLYDIL